MGKKKGKAAASRKDFGRYDSGITVEHPAGKVKTQTHKIGGGSVKGSKGSKEGKRYMSGSK